MISRHEHYQEQHAILDNFIRGGQAGFTEEALNTYYNQHNGDALAGYIGRHFDTWGGHRGDDESVKDVIDSTDVAALSALSIDRGIAKIHLGIQANNAELNSLLGEIPVNVPLYAPEAIEYINNDSAGEALWRLLKQSGGKNLRVAAYKMTARKRPDLFPVYDTVTEKELKYPTDIWNCLYTYFRRDPSRVEDIRARRAAAEISQQPTELRCLDVALWMSGIRKRS